VLRELERRAEMLWSGGFVGGAIAWDIPRSRRYFLAGSTDIFVAAISAGAGDGGGRNQPVLLERLRASVVDVAIWRCRFAGTRSETFPL